MSTTTEPTAYLVFDCTWIYDPENDSLGDNRDNDEYFETYEDALFCWQNRCSQYEDPEEGVDAVYLEAMGGGDEPGECTHSIDTLEYWERIPMDKYKSDKRAKETAIYNGVELPRFVDGREVVRYPNAGRVPKVETPEERDARQDSQLAGARCPY